LGIRFLVECKSHLFPFVGTKIDINTIEGYQEDNKYINFPKEKDLDIYILLNNIRIHAKGKFLGRDKNIHKFLLKEHHFDKRNNIRLKVQDKNLICFVNGHKCELIDISEKTLKFSAVLPYSFLINLDKEKELTVAVGRKVFSFRGFLKRSPQKNTFLLFLNRGNRGKFLKLLGELIKSDQC